MDHIGSAHTPTELEVLRATVRQRMVGEGQDELDFGDGLPQRGRRRSVPPGLNLWGVLSAGFTTLDFDKASDGDEVFKQLVLVRLIELTSKRDSLRVLDEMDIPAASYRTWKRRLALYAAPQWQRHLAAACATHIQLGPATLVLYNVSALYFETDAGVGIWETGFSKERRLEPPDRHRAAH